MDRIGRQIKNQRGKGIVEYLMMMGVIVGVILVIGAMFKPQVSGIFNEVMGRISSTIVTVGGPN